MVINYSMYLYIKVDMPFCEKVDKYSKAESIQFENMSIDYENVISEFRSVEDLNLFRLNLFNYIKTKVKCEVVKKSEVINWDVIEKTWFKMTSDIMKIPDDIFAKCCPFYVRKKHFWYNSITRKYYSNCNLIYQYSYN